MERRGFIKGIFGGLTAAGLIVTAKPEEIQAFASPLARGEPLLLDKPQPQHVGMGQHLYNEHGQLVAIVTEVKLSPRQMIDVTSFHQNEYIQGLHDFEIRASGVGEVRFLNMQQGIVLEGVPKPGGKR